MRMGKQKKEGREYVAKGVSAHPEWWAELEDAAQEMGLNRSSLIRLAVNDYLKGERADTPVREMAAA